MLSNLVCIYTVSTVEERVMWVPVVDSNAVHGLCDSYASSLLPADHEELRQAVPEASAGGSAIASVQSMLLYCMENPIHFGCPAPMMGIIHLLHEILQSLLLSFIQGQGLSNICHLIKRLYFEHSRAKHHQD